MDFLKKYKKIIIISAITLAIVAITTTVVFCCINSAKETNGNIQVVTELTNEQQEQIIEEAEEYIDISELENTQTDNQT